MDSELDNFSWAREHENVSRYVFNRRAPKPKISYLRGFFGWLAEADHEARGLTPEELVEYQLECERRTLESGDPRHKYTVTGLLRDYLRSMPGRRASYKQNIASCVYTFFNVNRVPLPEDEEVARAAKYSTKRKVNKDRWVTVEHLWDLKRMISGNTNLTYRAVYLAMYTAGMGMDEIVEWSGQGVEATEEKLRRGLYGRRAIKIYLEPRKDLDESRSYHTYLYARDAVEALEAWLERRRWRARNLEKRGEDLEATAEGHLFLTTRNTPITTNAIGKAFMHRSRRLGIYEPREEGDPGNRYGWSSHIIRSFFKTWGWKTPAPTWIWDAMMGHGVDSNEYMRLFNDDRWMLEQLDRAEPWFNILSSPVPFDLESKYKIDELEDRLEDAKRSHDTVIARLEAEMSVIRKALANPEAGPALMRVLRELEEKAGTR